MFSRTRRETLNSQPIDTEVCCLLALGGGGKGGGALTSLPSYATTPTRERLIQLSLKHEPNGVQDGCPSTPSIDTNRGRGSVSAGGRSCVLPSVPSLQEVHLPRPFLGSRHLKDQKFSRLKPPIESPAVGGACTFGASPEAPHANAPTRVTAACSSALAITPQRLRCLSESVPRRLPASFQPICRRPVLQLHFVSRLHVSHFH